MQSVTPKVLSAEDHQIDPELVDSNGVRVVEELHSAGFEAYLVGGCVRDLLLGQEPKDFDVATNATPEQVKEVFRRCRLVGRRFRIAHVRFGRDIIEVSTFRQGETDGIETSPEGMILRDNQYGSLTDDAFRRDFTVNALYYDPTSQEVFDYVEGLKDITEQQLVFIGDTEQRVAEDPVRVLRALRFHAKLDFNIAPEIQSIIPDAANRLTAIPPARLFEEFNKLFMLGYAERAWQVIANSPVCGVLFPCTDPHSRIVNMAMANTDERIRQDKPVTPGFLIAVMLWEDYRARRDEFALDHNVLEASNMAEQDTLADQQDIMSVPRRFSQFAREVWQMQPRLEQRHGQYIKRTVGHPRFRAAYDLLELRAKAYEEQQEAYEWWTTYQGADEETQHAMIAELPEGKAKRRRRRRRKRNNRNGNSQPADNS